MARIPLMWNYWDQIMKSKMVGVGLWGASHMNCQPKDIMSCMSCSSSGRSPLGKVLRTAKARNSTNTAAAAGTALMKTLSAGGHGWGFASWP